MPKYTEQEQDAYDAGFSDAQEEREEIGHRCAGHITDLVRAIRGNAVANEVLDRLAERFDFAERVALARSAA